MDIKQMLWYIYGWIFIRPRRWLFWKMSHNYYLTFRIKRWEEGWNLPNLHWWLMYQTIYKFFRWVYYDGWRPLCQWNERYRETYPLLAKIIHWIGETTAGYSIMGHCIECYHCGSKKGNPVDLANDDTGKTFILKSGGSLDTEYGSGSWWYGTTICPVCGYRGEYSDSSV